MNKVHVVNKNNQNFTKLDEFGEVRYITDGFINTGDINLLIYSIVSKLEEIRKDDYIVLTGPIILNVIIAHYMLSTYGSMNILTWSRSKLSYKPQTIQSELVNDKKG